jgi:predicted DNA-binding transcriptional regulator AlpA
MAAGRDNRQSTTLNPDTYRNNAAVISESNMQNEKLSAPSQWMDERELSADWKVSITTLRNWRCLGEGPRFAKIGKRCVRYRRADVEAFIAGDAGKVA